MAERSEVDGGAVPVGPCLTLLHPHLASPSEEGEGWESVHWRILVAFCRGSPWESQGKVRHIAFRRTVCK